jgi:hypothetical protein
MEIQIREGCGYPLPYKYSKYLFLSSFLMALTALISIYFNEGFTSLYYFLLFLTSINFWRKPQYGLRYKIDKMLVYAGVVYVLIYIYILLNKEFYRIMFINLFLCVLMFYMIEHTLYYFNSTKWIVFHMAIHLYVSMMGLFILVIY